MKLKHPMTADYDPTTKMMKISGKNSLGKSSVVELEVPDEESFIGWLVATIHEKYRRPSGGGRALIADRLSIGIHPDGEGYGIAFTFGVKDMQLSFVTAIQTKAPERIAAIQGHLEQLIKELENPDPIERQ